MKRLSQKDLAGNSNQTVGSKIESYDIVNNEYKSLAETKEISKRKKKLESLKRSEEINLQKDNSLKRQKAVSVTFVALNNIGKIKTVSSSSDHGLKSHSKKSRIDKVISGSKGLSQKFNKEAMLYILKSTE